MRHQSASGDKMMGKRQQDRDEWVRLNTCRFCIGSHLHSCTGYDCRDAIRQAEEAFDKMKMNRATDLTPWFTDDLKGNGNIVSAWILSTDDKKEIVIKFSKDIPENGRKFMLTAISSKLLATAICEDIKAAGESSFGNMMDGMSIREWNEHDGEFVRTAIPHEMEESQK